MGEAVIFLGVIIFALIMFTGGAPLIILADWLKDRGKTKRVLAEARLQEAKNAAAKRHAESDHG